MTSGTFPMTSGTSDHESEIPGDEEWEDGTMVQLGSQALAALETDLQRQHVLLATPLIDDSSSIEIYENTEAMISGQRAYIGSLDAGKNILVRTRFLNGEFLTEDYISPGDEALMDSRNYHPRHGTPLYDQTYNYLNEIRKKVAELVDQGKNVFTFSPIFTDGHDQHSTIRGPDDVKKIVEEMLAENRHIVAGIGVEDGKTDFACVFESMGIPEQWIKVLKRRGEDIQRGFSDVSDLTRRSSVSAADFTQTSETGFNLRPPSSKS